MGHGIPAHITGLPAEVLATPFGQMLLPQLRAVETELNSRHQHSVGLRIRAKLESPLDGCVILPSQPLPSQAMMSKPRRGGHRE